MIIELLRAQCETANQQSITAKEPIIQFLKEGECVAVPINMLTPQMNYVNENSQSNRKEQRRGNDNNK